MFMDRKTQYFQGISSSQLDVQIEHSPNQNPSKLLCGNQQTDSKLYTERQKTQSSQFNNGEEQSWRMDTL